MDEQHGGLCIPISVAGISFFSILFINVNLSSTLFCSNYICSCVVQFLREYTGKVDDLVKDKIESQKEEKAKEKEEKDLVAQQVIHSELSQYLFQQATIYV